MEPRFDEALPVLQKIAEQAESASKEPGPGDVGPTVQGKGAAQTPLVSLPFDEEFMSEWWLEIQRSRERITARAEGWKVLLQAYLPIVTAAGDAESVKCMDHFRNVHSKMGDLFYVDPDLVMTPKDPGPAQNTMPNPMAMMVPPGMPPLPPLMMEDVISIKQAFLKDKMGRDGIKASRLMDELLFDVLAWSGIGCCKVGYKCVTTTYQEPVMVPAPLPVGGAPDPLLAAFDGQPPQQPQMVPQMDPATGQPVTRPVEVPIHESYYSRRFSPLKLLVNSDLFSSRYDEDSTWRGMEFYMSPKRAMLPPERGGFGLSEEEVSKACEDEQRFVYTEDSSSSKKPGLIHGVECWVKAEYFTDNPHPEAYAQLVLIEGIQDRPIVWRMSPDQTFDEVGRLSKDSVTGNPIRILTIRDLADSAFPPSDAAFTNSEIKQLTTWLRQSIALRDVAIGKYLYDIDAFSEPGQKESLENGPVGCLIGVASGKLANGTDKIFGTTAQVRSTPDDYRGAEIIQRKLDETIGVSANDAGVETATVRSATETARIAQRSRARSAKEKARVVDFYLDLARMVDQFLMRYATQTEYIEVVGVDGAKKLMAWAGNLAPGRYLYDIAPDSQMPVDAAAEFERLSKAYNLSAKDPLVNRAYILRRMFRTLGLDPSKAVLNPAMAMLAPQPPHDGQATAGGTVSQHATENTGNIPNAPGAKNPREEPHAAGVQPMQKPH